MKLSRWFLLLWTVLIIGGGIYITRFAMLNPGGVVIDWLDYRIEMSAVTLVAAVLLFISLGWLCYFVISRLVSFPFRMQQKLAKRREYAALERISQAYGELLLENPKRSVSLLQSALSDLSKESPIQTLGKMIEGTALRASGQGELAEKLWQPLLEQPKTEMVAMRGLLDIAKEHGDWNGAIELAERGYQRAPKEPKMVQTLLQLYKHTGRFEDAYGLVMKQKQAWWSFRKTAINVERELAFIETAKAQKLFAKGKSDEAIELVKLAIKHDSAFAEALALWVQYSDVKEPAPALLKAIERVWKYRPLPELGDFYFDAHFTLPINKRLKLNKKLTSVLPQHPESHFLLARTYLEKGDYVDAEAHISRALKQRESARYFEVLLEVKQSLLVPNKEEIDTVRSKLFHASEGAFWQCAACGIVPDQWQSHCGACGHVDTIKWRHTSEPVLEENPKLSIQQ